MQKSIIVSFLFTLLNLATLTPACATTIGYSGSAVDLGTVVAGQSGTIANPLSVLDTSTDSGSLPNNTAITFSYTISGFTGTSLTDNGSYSYTKNGAVFSGSSSDVSGLAPVSTGTTSGAVSTALVLASANLNAAGTLGTTTITNISGSAAQFQSIFSGLQTSLGRSVSISYSVSAVPLPASLPMFAAVLAGMVGFAMLRRKHMVR